MSWNQTIPGATFTTTNGPGNQVTAQLCWTPVPSNVGSYSFTVTVQDDACPLVGSNTFTYTINIVDNPNDPIDAGLPDLICLGDTTTLNATTTATNVTSYIWSPTIGLSDPTSATTQAYPTTTTTYTIVQYADGCFSTDQVTITVRKILL